MIGESRKDWKKIMNTGVEGWKQEQEGEKTKGNLNEFNSKISFGVTVFTVKCYIFNT